MISPTTNSNLFAPTTPKPTTPANKTTLDKDAFLKLFVTQLKNQDPSSPLQPYELASQLAQFTSVEQLSQLNTAMASQTTATQATTLISQAALSTSLFGRQVIAAGDMVSIPASGAGRIHVDVGGAGGQASLTILDNNGEPVGTRDLGRVGPGSQDIALPSNLPPGNWHYSLTVTGANKASVPVTTYTMGTVSGVEFGGSGALTIDLGTLTVAFTDLVQIMPATTNNGGATTPPVPGSPPAVRPPLPGDPINDPIGTVLPGRH